MTNDDLIRAALECAYASLNLAASELTVAMLLAPRRSALANDAYLLAEAVEAEVAAVECTLRRRC